MVIWWLGWLDRFITSFKRGIVPCINVCLRIGTVTSQLIPHTPAFRWASYNDVPIWDIKPTTEAHVRVSIPFFSIGCLL